MIKNKGKIACKRKYCNVKLTMGDYQVQRHMCILPLGGCDMVLEVQWL